MCTLQKKVYKQPGSSRKVFNLIGIMEMEVKNIKPVHMHQDG